MMLAFTFRFVRDYSHLVLYCINEYDPLMDSCNMNMDDWAKLARDIESHYDQFDGFVILHGTDTMCYTASALSFMLENLGKPVILTGAQVSQHLSLSSLQSCSFNVVRVLNAFSTVTVCSAAAIDRDKK